MFRSFALLLLFFTNAAAAQSVNDCAWQASAWNLAEPWEANTRTFATAMCALTFWTQSSPQLRPITCLCCPPPMARSATDSAG